MENRRVFLDDCVNNGIKLFDELESYFGFKNYNPESRYDKIDPLFPPLLNHNLLKIVLTKIDRIIRVDFNNDSETFINEIPVFESIPRYVYNNGEPVGQFNTNMKFCCDLPYQMGYWNYYDEEKEHTIRQKFSETDFVSFFKDCKIVFQNLKSNIDNTRDEHLDEFQKNIIEAKDKIVQNLISKGSDIYSQSWYL